MGQQPYRVYVGEHKQYWYSSDPNDRTARLGGGNFGQVFRGYRTLDGAVFAIKRIEKSSTEADELVMRELHTLMKCDHPNIVKIHEFIFSQDSEFLYLVMEYCSAGDFSKVLESCVDEEGLPTGLEESVLKRFLRNMLSGVKYLHTRERPIVHRDLKPKNLVISGSGVLKICDFGLARFARSKEEATMTVCGSPAYCAPEIRRAMIERSPSARYSPSADIYSIGTILYEMLHGRQYDLSRIRGTVKEPSSSLGELCARMLEEDPSLRPTATELVELPELADETPSETSEIIGNPVAVEHQPDTSEVSTDPSVRPTQQPAERTHSVVVDDLSVEVAPSGGNGAVGVTVKTEGCQAQTKTAELASQTRIQTQTDETGNVELFNDCAEEIQDFRKIFRKLELALKRKKPDRELIRLAKQGRRVERRISRRFQKPDFPPFAELKKRLDEIRIAFDRLVDSVDFRAAIARLKAAKLRHPRNAGRLHRGGRSPEETPAGEDEIPRMRLRLAPQVRTTEILLDDGVDKAIEEETRRELEELQAEREILNDMAFMASEQSTYIDTIEDNITNAVAHIERGRKQVPRHQKGGLRWLFGRRSSPSGETS